MKPHSRRPNPKTYSSIPKVIADAARSRPLLRVKNIHSDLNGNDLSDLFGSISQVDFVMFDPKHSDVAYVCYQRNQGKNNSLAISKFDGRKAMGEILIVENATSLADRVMTPASRGSGISKGRNVPLKRKQKPTKKSLDTLDDELEHYMSGTGQKPASNELQEDKLDKEMDSYWKNQDHQSSEPSTLQEKDVKEQKNDQMNLD